MCFHSETANGVGPWFRGHRPHLAGRSGPQSSLGDSGDMDTQEEYGGPKGDGQAFWSREGWRLEFADHFLCHSVNLSGFTSNLTSDHFFY